MDSFINSSWSWCTQCEKSFTAKLFAKHIKTVHNQIKETSPPRKKNEKTYPARNQIKETSSDKPKKRKSETGTYMENIKADREDGISNKIEPILKSPDTKIGEENIPKKRKIGPASKTGRAKIKVSNKESANGGDEGVNVNSKSKGSEGVKVNDDDPEGSDSDHGIPKTMPQSSEDDSENSDDDFNLPFKLPLDDDDVNSEDEQQLISAQTTSTFVSFNKYSEDSSDDSDDEVDSKTPLSNMLNPDVLHSIVRTTENEKPPDDFKKRRPGPASKTGRMRINKNEDSFKPENPSSFLVAGKIKSSMTSKSDKDDEGSDSEDPDGDLEENNMVMGSDLKDPNGDLEENNMSTDSDGEDPDGDLEENMITDGDGKDPDGDLGKNNMDADSDSEDLVGDLEANTMVGDIDGDEGSDSEDPDGDLEENNMDVDSDSEDPEGNLEANTMVGDIDSDEVSDSEDPDGELEETNMITTGDFNDPDGDLEENIMITHGDGEDPDGEFGKKYLDADSDSDSEDPDGELEGNNMVAYSDSEDPDGDLEESNTDAANLNTIGADDSIENIDELYKEYEELKDDITSSDKELENGEIYNKDPSKEDNANSDNDSWEESDDENIANDEFLKSHGESFDEPSLDSSTTGGNLSMHRDKTNNSHDISPNLSNNEDKGKEDKDTGKEPDFIENDNPNVESEPTSNNKMDKSGEMESKSNKDSDQIENNLTHNKNKSKFRIPKNDVIVQKSSPKKSTKHKIKTNRFSHPNQFSFDINDQIQSNFILNQLMQTGQIVDNSNPMIYQMGGFLDNQPQYVGPDQMFNNQIAYIDQNQIFNSQISHMDQDQMFNNQIPYIDGMNQVFDNANQIIDPTMQMFGEQNHIIGLQGQTFDSPNQDFGMQSQMLGDQSFDQTGQIFNDQSLDQTGLMFNDQSLNDALAGLTANELQNLNDAITQQPDLSLSNQIPMIDPPAQMPKELDETVIQASPSDTQPPPSGPTTKKPKVTKPAPNGPAKRSAPNKWTLSSEDLDESKIKLSNDMVDVCKTYCKLCNEAIKLVNMRNHTKAKHKMSITEYKTQFGTEYEIIEKVYHKCGICSIIILLDSDSVATHLKTPGHKAKDPKGTTHKQYNEQYMVMAKKPTKESK